MNYVELNKKLEQSIKGAKCANKGCLSANKDNLEVVWYGKQYEQKLITCSSCYIMNDEAVKKSLPTNQNILPVSGFINKFVSQLKTYEETKSSPRWLPTDLKQRQKQHATEMDNFQFKLTGTLKSLAQALQNFTKKVIQHNQSIYNNETFNQIITMYSNNQMDQSLPKIQSLIQYLNCSQDDKYRFDDIQFRNKRTDKLAQKIEEVNKKVTTVLEDLLLQIQDKYAVISKI